ATLALGLETRRPLERGDLVTLAPAGDLGPFGPLGAGAATTATTTAARRRVGVAGALCLVGGVGVAALGVRILVAVTLVLVEVVALVRALVTVLVAVLAASAATATATPATTTARTDLVLLLGVLDQVLRAEVDQLEAFGDELGLDDL